MSRGLPLLGQMVRYALGRGGMLSMGGSLTTGYLRSRLDLDEPDLQFFSSPATADIAKTLAAPRMVMEGPPGMTFNLYQSRPQSRGHVRIASADPHAPPAILHGYLTEETDRRVAIDGLRLARLVLGQPALAPFIDHVMTPDPSLETEEALLAYLRATGTTAFHESGTVAMGGQAGDPLTPMLEVRGVAGLRVADASVMPRMVSGNTNAATIMIAEKAADMMLAAAR
jgi:choline dehydrogenase